MITPPPAPKKITMPLCVFTDLRKKNSDYFHIQRYLVFISEKWSVYCAVRTDFLNVLIIQVQVNFYFCYF
jgi:hypothetical protein